MTQLCHPNHPNYNHPINHHYVEQHHLAFTYQILRELNECTGRNHYYTAENLKPIENCWALSDPETVYRVMVHQLLTYCEFDAEDQLLPKNLVDTQKIYRCVVQLGNPISRPDGLSIEEAFEQFDIDVLTAPLPELEEGKDNALK